MMEEQAVRAPTGSTMGGGPKIEMIVDRSGSMQPLLAATVSGLNEFMGAQRAQLPDASSATVRLHVFDQAVETVWPEGTRLLSAPRVTERDVFPRGTTALLDAIGMTLGSLPIDEPRIVCIVRRFYMHACTQHQAVMLRMRYPSSHLHATPNAGDRRL